MDNNNKKRKNLTFGEKKKYVNGKIDTHMKLQRILLKNSKYQNHWFPVEELTDDQIIEIISQETIAEINDSEEEIAVISNTEALDSIEK